VQPRSENPIYVYVNSSYGYYRDQYDQLHRKTRIRDHLFWAGNL